MLFSILIANYNNGIFFKDCYDSILAQTYQDFEVIIVDDASADNSVEIMSELIKGDPRFKLFVNEQNKGCGFTKRKLAELATGDYCGYLDPDDTIVPEALETIVNALELNPAASLASSKYYLVDADLNITRACTHTKPVPDGYSFLTYGRGVVTAFAGFRKALYDKTDGIDAKFKRAVDQDLYFKLEEVGEIVYVDEFLYLYRKNENSISSNDNVFKARYWHYVAMKDAYLRRKRNGTTAINFTPAEFRKMESDYYITRIHHETAKKHYRKKYYFVVKSILADWRIDWKYKMLCLIRPDFY
jgi:glycosyltransferase involved in cell wall biosynthesis